MKRHRLNGPRLRTREQSLHCQNRTKVAVEVYKRNTDVIEGIRHTAQVLPRFGQSAVGFVVTDGYEGDYTTWKESLVTGVAVATLADFDCIAKNPQRAFKVLAERAGITEGSAPQNLPVRTMPLCE